MKARARRQRAIVEINITPFTDVILVLLIIFMITTPLILQSSIKVNLPRAASGETIDRGSDQVGITLSDKNLIYLDDAVVTRRQLKEKMTALHKKNPELRVVLFSDRLTRFKEIVTVLDVLKEIGVHNLSIAAKTE